MDDKRLMKDDVKWLMKDNYIKYASYVILDRAIPNVIDGLKPVQRRILYILWLMHDGKLHKVANVAGQTMAYHPHGDAPIIEALVNLANKGYLLDRQGNFGNLYTGDPAAAARYIETRLSPLAKEVLFNPELTPMVSSYDGRHQEPTCLPVKIPLLLIQGAEGIAVGMATHILPHNFVELLESEIAILEDREFTILPDFPTGGIMDASQYDKGRGKVKLRARMDIVDAKTIIIREICYGTTTESLIRSIDEAAKRGRIKIEAINDYTSDKVEVEIKLPRGIYAQDLIEALYGFTECEVTLNSLLVTIKDDSPWEGNVEDMLRLHTEKLVGYLHRELEIELARLLEKVFEKTLEQIFIENRLYKLIENIASYDKIHDVIEEALKPFHSKLSRIPNYEDREKLLNIPIRRISRFDLNKNKEEIALLNDEILKVEQNLKNIKKYTIKYLKGLLAKYGKDFARKTELQTIGQIDRRAIETRHIKVGFDPESGFIGTKVSGGVVFDCTNFDKLLVMYKDGSYNVINIPEKQYVQQNGNKVVYAGVADKKTIFNVAYKDPKTHKGFAKRFIIEKFILDKNYRYFEEEMELLLISTDVNLTIEVQLIPKSSQKINKTPFSFEQALVKGVTAKGIRLTPKEVKKVIVLKEG